METNQQSSAVGAKVERSDEFKNRMGLAYANDVTFGNLPPKANRAQIYHCGYEAGFDAGARYQPSLSGELGASVQICQTRLRSGHFEGEYFAEALQEVLAAVQVQPSLPSSTSTRDVSEREMDDLCENVRSAMRNLQCDPYQITHIISVINEWLATRLITKPTVSREEMEQRVSLNLSDEIIDAATDHLATLPDEIWIVHAMASFALEHASTPLCDIHE